MKPSNLRSIPIKDIRDLVTNIEEQDLSENFALELDGFRNTKAQTVGQRDYGSRHLYALPPLRPNTVYAVSSIAFSSGTATVTMTDALPAGIVGTTVTVWIDENTTGGLYSIYNGVWPATVVSTTSLTIPMVSGQGTLAGGILSLAPVTIVDGTSVYDSDRQRSFDVIVGLDESGSYHVYVYDQDPLTNLYRWVDLAASYVTTLSAVSLGGNNTDKLLFGSVTYGGEPFTLPNSGDLSGWVGYYVYNQTRHSIGVIAMGQSGSSYNCVVSRSYSFSAWQAGDDIVISPSRDCAVLGGSPLTAAPTSFLSIDAQKKVEIYTGNRVLRVQYRDKQVFGAGQIDTAYADVPTGLSVVAGSGSLSPSGATTYWYRVAAVTSAGTSYPCASQSISINNAGAVLSWTAVPGATSYVIYRERQITDSLAPADPNSFQAVVISASTNSYTDDGTVGDPTGTQICFEQSHVALVPTPAGLVSSVIPQPAGWYLEYSTIAPGCVDYGVKSFHVDGGDTAGGGLIKMYGYEYNLAMNGSPSVPLPAQPWLQLNLSAVQGVSPVLPTPNIITLYLTAIYNGYEEGDPFLKVTYVCDTGTSGKNVIDSTHAFIRIELGLFVLRSLIDPAITGINVYAAAQQYAVNTPGTAFQPAPELFKLLFGLDLRQNASDYVQQNITLNDLADGSTAISPVTWTSFFSPVLLQSNLNAPSLLTTVDNYDVWGIQVRIEGGQAMNPGTDSIDAELNHAPDMIGDPKLGTWNYSGSPIIFRNEVKPRYVARPSRSQSALIAVDQDDATLRFCNVDGAGVVDDEVFPDLALDGNGSKLTAYLMSRGPLLGIGWVNGRIVALKASEAELIDPTAAMQEVIPADCVAPKSILNTEFGLVWAGRYGIYIMPSDGGPIRKINKRWSNIYDGTTISPSGNPYIQDQSTIVTGYNRLYKEIVFAMMMWNDNLLVPGYQSTLARFDAENDKWAFRRLSITGPSAAAVVPSSATKLNEQLSATVLVAGASSSSTLFGGLTGSLSAVGSSSSP